MLYLLLATVAVAVQWNKWQALHHKRNMVAFVIAVTILLVAATYLLRAFQARRGTEL